MQADVGRGAEAEEQEQRERQGERERGDNGGVQKKYETFHPPSTKVTTTLVEVTTGDLVIVGETGRKSRRKWDDITWNQEPLKRNRGGVVVVWCGGREQAPPSIQINELGRERGEAC